MKLSTNARRLARRATGTGRATPISGAELRELAAREPVVVVAVGNLRRGQRDERLPGEHREAALIGLAAAVADVPRERAIVLHCG